ncbi:MAG: transposase, partial [Mucilaginibacter sp.]|nr:transposase [Mucilaginibacter sp.]
MFIRQHAGVKDKNRFVWFEDWVIGRQTFNQISEESGYTTRTLSRYFHAYLSKSPVFSVYPSERVNLLIDGTYFTNDLCLILYRDNTIKFTQLYRLTNGEWYEELKEDLENLLKLGVQIESITCDGHKALLKAVRKVCKQAIVQRCLVHIQRMCRIWLTSRPQSQPGIELRRIVSKLHLIKTITDRDYWIVSLVNWHDQHQAFINEKSFNTDSSRYWYKHKLLRRSFMVIKKAWPDMFHYLDNPRIPKSTNGLESFFGHLKGNLNIHRGLSHA